MKRFKYYLWYVMILYDNQSMVEEMGFEPMKPLGLHAFQACAIDHSAIPPELLIFTLWTIQPSPRFAHPQYESLKA